MASLHFLVRTQIETKKGAMTLRDMFPVNQQLLDRAASDATSRTRILREQVDCIEKKPATPIPIDDVSGRIRGLDVDAHRQRYRDSFFSTATDRILFVTALERKNNIEWMKLSH